MNPLAVFRRAWAYSQRRPVEAIVYAGAVLVAAYFARLLLAVLALALMIGALQKLLRE